MQTRSTAAARAGLRATRLRHRAWQNALPPSTSRRISLSTSPATEKCRSRAGFLPLCSAGLIRKTISPNKRGERHFLPGTRFDQSTPPRAFLSTCPAWSCPDSVPPATPPYTNGDRGRAQKRPVSEAVPNKLMPRSSAVKPTNAGAKRRSGLTAEAEEAAPREPAPAATDAEILALAQAGDHQAFAQLYGMHKRRIYSLCLRMVGNVAEAEDLTQEAFLQLHRKIATFRGDSAFSTWLHRLTINVVLMQLRKKGLPLISLDEAMEPAPEEGPGRSFGAPDLTLSGAIDRLVLERAVADLPAGYRLIFILHDVEGFEHNEIASMLDCSIGNSKSQLHKARLKLRDALRVYSRKEAQP